MLNQDEKTTSKSKEEDESISFIVEKPFEDDINTIFFTGDVSEESANRLIIELVECSRIAEDKEDAEDIKIYLNTEGGSAYEMFAIYDAMRIMREECEIQTLGLGKVMSAGVLLLAAGTKGSRKIGKNCRVMIHSVMGGQHGPVFNLENEMEEVKWLQEQYVDSLIEETDMTKRYIKKLLARKVNVYLTAREAVELGIADEVI